MNFHNASLSKALTLGLIIALCASNASSQDRHSMADQFSGAEIQMLSAAASEEQERLVTQLKYQSDMEYLQLLDGKDDDGKKETCESKQEHCDTNAHNAWVVCRANASDWFKNRKDECLIEFPGSDCILENPKQFDCLKEANRQYAQLVKACNNTKATDLLACLNDYRKCLGLPPMPPPVVPPVATQPKKSPAIITVD